jgi:hypothetical protein
VTVTRHARRLLLLAALTLAPILAFAWYFRPALAELRLRFAGDEGVMVSPPQWPPKLSTGGSRSRLPDRNKTQPSGYDE